METSWVFIDPPLRWRGKGQGINHKSCGRRIMVITRASQARDVSSILIARSTPAPCGDFPFLQGGHFFYNKRPD